MRLVSEELRKRRGRPRKVHDESAQPSPFPESRPAPDVEISNDAEAKNKTLEAAKKIPEIFTPEQVKWVFDAYVAVLCFVYSIALKTDYKALEKELEFSEEQKDMMAKPLARICSKYAPASWAAMSAEIELIMLIGVWTISSFQRAKNVAIAEEEKKRDAERTKPVAPMNRQPMPQREILTPA